MKTKSMSEIRETLNNPEAGSIPPYARSVLTLISAISQ